MLKVVRCAFNPSYSGNPKAGILADSEDPDEMQHNRSGSALFAKINTTIKDRNTP